MVKKYPKLERGENASETGRDHIPPRIFKEMARLNKQRAKLGELLGGVNAFNAKSRAEEIGRLLDEYILIQRIEIHNSDRSDGHCHVKAGLYFAAIGMIDIPTKQELNRLRADYQKRKRPA